MYENEQWSVSNNNYKNTEPEYYFRRDRNSDYVVAPYNDVSEKSYSKKISNGTLIVYRSFEARDSKHKLMVDEDGNQIYEHHITFNLITNKTNQWSSTIPHRLDGPAVISTNNFKRAKCEYIIEGNTIPKYIFFEQRSKIDFLYDTWKKLKDLPAFSKYNISVNLNKKNTIRMDLHTQWMPDTLLFKLIEELNVATDSHYTYTIAAGYDMQLNINLYLKKDAKLSMNKTFESNTEFFEV